MKRFIFIAVPFLLTGCGETSGINSASAAHACNVAITASAAVQDIAAFFIAHGWEAAKAQKVATAIRTFQLPVQEACALLAP